MRTGAHGSGPEGVLNQYGRGAEADGEYAGFPDERRPPLGDLFAQKRNMRGARALCGECGRQVEDDAAGIPLVAVGGGGGYVEFDFGRMVLAAAGCTHLAAGRSRKVRHMVAMAAARVFQWLVRW